MTNYEASYFSDFDPADPLGGIDHALVCENVLSEFMAAESLTEALNYEQGHQMHLDRTAYDTLLTLGSHMIPMTESGEQSSDNMRQRIFLSGTLVALKTLDALCATIDLQPEVFRKVWHANGAFTIVDTSSDRFNDMTAREKYEAIGDGIVALGLQFLDNMKPELQKLIATLSDEHTVLPDPNLFKASYGYALGSGLQMLSRLLNEVEYRNVVARTDMENGPGSLLEEPIPVEFVPDEILAEKVDDLIFYTNEDGAEVFLGKSTEDLLDREDETVETLQALSLVLYPNEYGNGALDETGEAFFMGGILGLTFAEKHCDALDIGFDEANRKWRRDGAHAKLSKLDFIPEGRMSDVDEKVIKVLQSTELSIAVSGLLDKISYHLEYDLNETVAFKNGLQYVLVSYKKVLQRCINAKINLRVRQASATLDDEISRLLSE